MPTQDPDQLVTRAETDAAFRTDLLANPRGVLERAGVTLPPDVAVQVFENDATTFHAVLPLAAGGDSLERLRQADPAAAKVYEKAWRDPAFKQRLLTQPRQAFVEATGMMPPASLTLVAHEDTPRQIHLVLPYVAPDGELSDADLEQVAGGKGHKSSCKKREQEVVDLGPMVTLSPAAVVVGPYVAGVMIASAAK